MVRVELGLLGGREIDPQAQDAVAHGADVVREAGGGHVVSTGGRVRPELADDADAGRVGADVRERSRRRLDLADVDEGRDDLCGNRESRSREICALKWTSWWMIWDWKGRSAPATWQISRSMHM